MFQRLYSNLSGTSEVSVVIIAVAIVLICGFGATRVARLLRLPNVTAYILAGVAIGPYGLNLLPSGVLRGMDFIPDIALAFIAFAAGEFFRFTTLRENGMRVVIITLLESLAASLLVFILTYYILHLGMAFSVILAALASATAPASTMMTIRQTGAKGDFVNTLLSVVALDDVVSLVAFSVAVSIAIADGGARVSAGTILKPIILNAVMVAIGGGLGWMLRKLMAGRSTDNRLIVSVAILFVLCGIGAAIGVSPLLACMACGMVYINLSGDERLFKQLNYFSPPILLIFFVKSGVEFRLDALTDMNSAIAGVPLLTIGVLYFFVRIAGKYLGAWLGCAMTHKSPLVRNWLGLALIPQAGVSIGLAALGARLLGGQTGPLLQTVILSSSILYEIIGPACAKSALYLSRSYVPGQFASSPPPSESAAAAPSAASAVASSAEPTPPHAGSVDALKARLAAIESELARQEYSRSEEELAVNQEVDAATSVEDDLQIYNYMKSFRKGGHNRR